jgi:hypothetical protein
MLATLIHGPRAIRSTKVDTLRKTHPSGRELVGVVRLVASSIEGCP